MPPTISAHATTTALPSSASICLPSSRPRIDRGEEGDQQVADEAQRDRIALEQARRAPPRRSPVEHDDGEDRAGLDGDVEQRPAVGVEAEQFGGEDQVAGRTDRQIFGEALDDAEDDDEQQDRHWLRRPWSAGRAQRPWKRLPPRKRPSHSSATAASGVGSIPNASRPGAPVAATLSRCSISHWSRVSGAPGRKPKLRQQLAQRCRASATRSGDWPVTAQIARWSSTMRQHLRARRSHRSCRHGVAGSSAAAAIAWRKVADIDRLETRLGRRAPAPPASGQAPRSGWSARLRARTPATGG